jgi:hypothetical protein
MTAPTAGDLGARYASMNDLPGREVEEVLPLRHLGARHVWTEICAYGTAVKAHRVS